MVPVALALSVAASATTAQAQQVGGGWLPDDVVPQSAATTSNQSPGVPLSVAAWTVNVPRPWLGGEDVLWFTAAIPGDEGAWQAPTRLTWPVPALPGADPDELPRLGVDEGVWVSPVVYGLPIDVPRPWLGGEDALPPSAPTAVGDEGEWIPSTVLPPPVLTLMGPLLASNQPVPEAQPVVGDEEGYQPVVVVPWLARPGILPPDTDEVPPQAPAPTLEDEGYVPVGPAVRWLAPPMVPGEPDESIVVGVFGQEQEGAGGFFVTLGGQYDLIPPPAGGGGPAAASTPFGLDDEPGTLPMLLGARPLFYDPELVIVAGDDLSVQLDEGAFLPGLSVWPWLAPRLPVWDTPEWVQAPSPFGLSEDYDPSLVGRAVLHQPGAILLLAQVSIPGPMEPAAELAFGLSEDHYEPPRARQAGAILLLHQSHDGGGPGQPLTFELDDYSYAVPMPTGPEYIVSLLVGGADDFVPPLFGLTEDLDPMQLVRAQPAAWRAKPLPTLGWDVDEARVAPVFASGARGTGRTHLFLGQVFNDPTPQSGGAELYVLTGGYGTPVGDDTALLIETPDIAPLGPAGRMRIRRVALPLQYDAACTVRITPIVDYMTELTPTLVTLAAPGRVTRAMIQVKSLTACTTIRLRLEVVSRNGPVELYRPSVFFSPLSGGTTMAMGGQP